MVIGVDVSHWRGVIDWPQVKAAGIAFAITKATEYGVYMGGSWQKDPTFAANWNGAKANGIIPGAFMMFRENVDGKVQADLFCDYVEEVTGGPQKFVWVDYERDDATANATSAANLQECVFSIWYRWGFLPAGIYTSRSKWAQLIEVNGHAPAWAGRLGLWMAYYGTNDGSMSHSIYLHNNLPSSWLTPTIWQYTSNGTVAGINGGVPPVDMNLWLGDMFSLKQAAGVELSDAERIWRLEKQHFHDSAAMKHQGKIDAMWLLRHKHE